MKLVVAILLLAGVAKAQEQVLVETQVRPDGEVWVGQRVSIYAQVSMAGRPTLSPRFDLPRVDGAVFLRAPGSPVLGTEQIDGTEYTTQRYELMLFAQRVGELVIPPIGIRVALADEEHRIETEVLTVRAKLPEGIDPGTPLITTAELSIEQTWTPEPGDATVGDAFERRVTIKAKNVLGLAIPPAPVPALDGLALYPADPTVDDRMNRGALEGTRSDVVTFVCARAGSYELPALVYRWWNPAASRLEERELPGVSFTVAANPDLVAEELPESEERGLAWLLLGSLGLGVGAFWFARRPALARWRAWQQRRDESELAYLERLQAACRSSDARASWKALVAWIARIDQATPTRQAPVVHEFAAARGAAGLAFAAEQLQRALIEGTPWHGDDLARAAGGVQREYLSAVSRAVPLPRPLNPL